jgi:hypothetical protein
VIDRSKKRHPAERDLAAIVEHPGEDEAVAIAEAIELHIEAIMKAPDRATVRGCLYARPGWYCARFAAKQVLDQRWHQRPG